MLLNCVKMCTGLELEILDAMEIGTVDSLLVKLRIKGKGDEWIDRE